MRRKTITARIVKEGDFALRGKELRLIGNDGEQIGIVNLQKAIELARQQGLDLVLVAPSANPPVCKIMNYGKFLYEQKKKEKEQKKAQQAQKVKEIHFSPAIDPHDYQTKLKHAIEFLQKGCKLKASMMFRGREISHQELGLSIMKKLIEDLQAVGVPESEPKLLGRNMILNFNPKPGHK